MFNALTIKNKILCEISLDDSIIIVQTKEEAKKYLNDRQIDEKLISEYLNFTVEEY